MKPKCIGIIGGAGPLAGAYLLERLFSLSGAKYGCYRDSDFPKVMLISFPFSEMLSKERDEGLLKKEIGECIKQLRGNGASVLGIACNTLHAFLDPKDNLNDLVHLPLTIAENMPESELPLVLCTTTSVEFGLHRRFFPCRYPDKKVQEEVDGIIDLVLKGEEKGVILEKLTLLIQRERAQIVILGCTELSIFSAHLKLSNQLIIDPLELMVRKILERAFS